MDKADARLRRLIPAKPCNKLQTESMSAVIQGIHLNRSLAQEAIEILQVDVADTVSPPDDLRPITHLKNGVEGGTYRFGVVAVNSQGDHGEVAWSSSVTATTNMGRSGPMISLTGVGTYASASIGTCAAGQVCSSSTSEASQGGTSFYITLSPKGRNIKIADLVLEGEQDTAVSSVTAGLVLE